MRSGPAIEAVETCQARHQFEAVCVWWHCPPLFADQQDADWPPPFDG